VACRCPRAILKAEVGPQGPATASKYVARPLPRTRIAWSAVVHARATIVRIARSAGVQARATMTMNGAPVSKLESKSKKRSRRPC